MIEYELLQKLYSIDTFAGYSDDEIKEMSEAALQRMNELIGDIGES